MGCGTKVLLNYYIKFVDIILVQLVTMKFQYTGWEDDKFDIWQSIETIFIF